MFRSFTRSQKWIVAAALAAGLSLSGVAAGHGGNPAQGGTSANPNGVGDGGGGIHNIAGGAPGQNGGVRDGDGKNPACTMHGRFQQGGTHAKKFCD
jgi:hypothetical protein